MRPYLFVFLGASLGGFSGIFVKLLGISSGSIAFFRFAVPTVLFGLFFLFKKHWPFHGNYGWMLFASLLNALKILFFVFGFLLTQIGNAQILFFTWPLFVALFEVVLLRQKIKKHILVLFALASLGIFIIFSTKDFSLSDYNFFGMAAILFSAILTGLMTVIMKKEIHEYSNVEAIFFQCLVGACIFLPFFVFSFPFFEIKTIGLGVFYGLLIGVFLWLFYFAGLRRLKASHFSLLTYWEVPAALVYAVLFLGETISVNQIVGAFCILGAGALLFFFDNKKERIFL
ncbi:MAG: hypothetical protein A3G08_03690 [Candidatus Magasanikbacteria bacterium RIFCSPLOWO2_12_FULL_47_9b]|nr:MAG: hypothetical protein A3I74_01020 [Candidatus Magasanikbacteria bacterium RIFCSPLOWO2_02_FULL_47_16]OGH79974.1 MAG: hypothetical protein A3C10_02205 [Candidatus Magasanikbacteria bacterium RIFCSPHIGHO2_02_FULL_48_18]OGH82986.1 MAG: hypothetical protein A3G08_03690 [Candidatus Magasanikbacteria bacterium RIFCSPLOWO2_12_FULL_47_9b]